MLAPTCDVPVRRGRCGQPAERVIIRVGRRAWDLDLCEEHMSHITKLTAWGRPVGNLPGKGTVGKTEVTGLD